MKWFVVLVLCGVELAAAEESKSDQLTVSEGWACAPNSRWQSQCNRCFCSLQGKAACTLIECPEHETEPERRCAPGTTWKQDCNSCWCTDKGHAVCTRIGCSNVAPGTILESSSPTNPVSDIVGDTGDQEKMKEDTKEESVKPQNPDKVEDTSDYVEHPDVEIEKPLEHSFEEIDYDIFDSDLNHVLAIHDHDNVLRESDEGDKKKHSLLKRSVCKPNEIFQTECNTCNCAPDGQSYTCTHNECMEGEKNSEVEVFQESEGVDHIERHTVCAARGTFYIGCNTCHCNALGTDYSCSNKPCKLPDDVELFHELRSGKSSNNRSTKQVCVANRMFIKDCNTCWCNEDGTSFVCTRKVCVPELPEEGADDKPEELRVILKECRPDEVFELDCNMCRCNSDGKSYSCTRRACADPVVDPADPVVDAVSDPVSDTVVVEPADPIVKTVDDNAKKTSLRRIARRVTTQQEAPKACSPSEQFRMDCNICLCDNEGQSFSCTRKDCSNGASARAKRESSETVTVPMDCVAGSVFDRDCNVCRCVSDGKHATCTNKPCGKKTAQGTENTPASKEDTYFRCNPGEQLKRGCNDCQCSADGRSVFCTVRFCDQDITPPPAV